MSNLIFILVMGGIATMVMDLWGVLRKPLLGIPAADYRLVGRWVSHLSRGRFRHDSIAASPAVTRESLVGWLAHYLLGWGFAASLWIMAGDDWQREPTLPLPLAFGLATVLVPFLVMQPAMGLGLAARRAPRPGAARVQSLLTHAVFAVGLYLGALAASEFIAWTG